MLTSSSRWASTAARNVCRQSLFLRTYSSGGSVNTLVVVEHHNGKIVGSTFNAISAAQKLGGSVTAIVAGENPDAAASTIAKVPGVAKVIVAKDASYEHGLPEAHAPLYVAAQKAGNFTHLVAPHSAFGKNVMPRVAALLDVAQVSDVTSVESPDTFVRPIYAGA